MKKNVVFMACVVNKDRVKKYGNFDILIKMVIINWFGLSEYNKNNILKCIGGYYYGIYLYN